MVQITRRDLVATGVALSAPALLGRQALAAANASMPAAAENAIAPREQLLFDVGWKFTFGHGSDPAKDLGFGMGQGDFAKTGEFSFAKLGFDDSAWRPLDLPHDWAVELPFVKDDTAKGDSQLRSHGYKPLGRRYPETSVGWYRREFDIAAAELGRRIVIAFDGAFRDVLVFVNGCFIGRNTNGYAPFQFDLSDFLVYGGKNVIAIRVDASFGDGWFYEGAGIYRHVWLTKSDAVHLGRWESVVRSTLNGDTASLALTAIVENREAVATRAKVTWVIRDAAGTTVATVQSPEQDVPADGLAEFSASAPVPHPLLWSPQTPNLYTAAVTVSTGGKQRDGEIVSFGIRTAEFDANKGFLLNGEVVKIQGTCNHQDHAGVGAALPDALQNFRLSVLREMGCNAVRTSHNMPAPEWVEACDHSGVMMMCETRLMNSNPEGMAQLEAMIKRYRNAPSIIIWSIGNEEWLLQDKMAEQGEKIAATMVRRCHELDPTRQVTTAVNGDNEKGVSEAVDVIGFNYNEEKWPDKFHASHPKRPVVGSETSSALSTRGEYITDPKRNTVNSYDGAADWGKTPEAWWNFYGTRDWLAGGFAWTGFDYRGEPTPYGWPSISSQFGIVDMCGFPKDYFYYYKAWWRKEPSLHLFPHWNWQGKEGQDVAVWVYTNLESVELFLNGRSLGRQNVPHLGHVQWKVAYQPGVIEARGYKGDTIVLVEKRETSGGAARLRLSTDRKEINADGEDVVLVRVEAFDSHGRPVPTAGNKLAFRVSGSGRLIGVGNGDPNCLESDKDPRRSLFNGLAQIIVQATNQPGIIHIAAASEDGTLTPAAISVRVKPAKRRLAVR
ncbi:beta-galactosidase [Rhizomicrobium palustre]|uniref:Beta-galactosidase n=1 Tax=Rhizomicrobium palustre TaxID=189966 RepID=A0A846MTZ4_9PROT|nr:beta-galactosidase GalA [Rhizomicrobium palustre]NIK86826.1 beta-galactosidase [Rhizomicrobium palustre]